MFDGCVYGEAEGSAIRGRDPDTEKIAFQFVDSLTGKIIHGYMHSVVLLVHKVFLDLGEGVALIGHTAKEVVIDGCVRAI